MDESNDERNMSLIGEQSTKSELFNDEVNLEEEEEEEDNIRNTIDDVNFSYSNNISDSKESSILPDSMERNALSDLVETVADNDKKLEIFELPDFATPEAHKIDKANKEKEKKLDILISKISDIDERIKVMVEHSKNVEQEIEYTNKLLESKTAEIETERHLKELAIRERSRTKLQKRKISEDIEKHQDEINIFRKKNSNFKNAIEEKKVKMNWNQEELRNFLINEKKKEDDYLAIEKYTRIDDVKVKEYSKEIENLTQQVLEAQAFDELKKSELLIKQAEVRRITEDCSKLHQERQFIVTQWENSITEMKRRDKEINDLGGQYGTMKKEQETKQGILREREKRLTAQQTDNREIESQNENLSRSVSLKREKLQNQQSKVKELKDEIATLQSVLISAAKKIAIKKVENVNIAQSCERYKVQLERERALFQKVKIQIAEANSSNLAIEEKAKIYEAELEQQKKDYELKIEEVKKMKDLLFIENQKVHEIKQEELRLQLLITGNKNVGKNYDIQISQLEKELSRQEEFIYNADFQIQQIERKVARGFGERSDEEKRYLNEEISKFERKVNENKERKKVLKIQALKLKNEYTNAIITRDELCEENNKFSERLKESELENRMLEDQNKRDEKSKEDSFIQNDLLRLEVRKLREILATKTDTLYNLQNKKEETLFSLEQQKQELYTSRDLLKAEIKIVSDEKHKLIMELKKQEVVINNLKSRFAVMTHPPDNGLTQAQVVIMTVQRKEELRRKGDELDKEIQKGENELVVLKTTLDNINKKNAAIKNGIREGIDGGEAKKVKQLKQSIEILKDDLHRLKKEYRCTVTDIQEDSRVKGILEEELKQSNEEEERLQKSCEELESEIRMLESDVDDIKKKVMNKIQRHRKEFCEKNEIFVDQVEAGTPVEKTAKAIVITDVTKNILFTLGQLAKDFPEISNDLKTLAQQKNLRIPMRPPYSRNPIKSIQDIRSKLNNGISSSPSVDRSENSPGSRYSTQLKKNSLPSTPKSFSLDRSRPVSVRSSVSSGGISENSTVLKSKCFEPDFGV